jgi:hypothetical protein
VRSFTAAADPFLRRQVALAILSLWPLLRDLRSISFVHLQRLKRFADQVPPHLFFLLGRNIGVANYVNDAVAQDDAVRAYHFCDGQSRRDLYGGDACLLQLSGDRSAAASAGPSG